MTAERIRERAVHPRWTVAKFRYMASRWWVEGPGAAGRHYRSFPTHAAAIAYADRRAREGPT